MFRHYIISTLRTIKRNRSHSFINIAGLVLGLTFFFLISLYIQFELSFDRYHENAGRIFRIARKLPEGHTHGGKTEAASMIPAVGPALVEDYPEVVSQVRLVRRRNLLLKRDRNGYMEPEVFFVEPDIFKIFSLPLVQGNARSALSDPDSIILSRSAALKYFGEENPLGKTIRFNQSRDLKVTGILGDMPKNSHFIMDVIIPFETLIASTQWDLTSWSSNFCSTYILLGEGVDPKELEKKLPALYQKHAEAEAKPGGYRYCQPFLQALVDIHLHSDLDGEFAPNNSVSNIYIFSTIAFLILLLACINYTSLATARFTLRGKEVGMRKTVGAQRSQLITQFLGESLLFTAIACLLSMAVVQLVLPVFNDLVGRTLNFTDLVDPVFYLWIPAVIFLTGCCAGIYPALFISSTRPAVVIKNLQFSGTGKLRSALVVFQFTVSAVLIISAVIVKNQLSHIRNLDVGYSKDQIVVIRLHDANLRNFDALKSEMKANPHILEVSISDALPNNIQSQSIPDWPGIPVDFPHFDIYTAAVDEGYLDVFNLELITGRKFSRDFPTDANGAFIFNQALVEALGWESPLGREFTYWRGETGRVIGVVKDFNLHSLHKDIEPMYLYYHRNPWSTNCLSVKIRGGNMPETLAFLRSRMKKFSPEYPLDYSFFDDIFDQSYRSEQRLSKMFHIFGFLAVGIACLGLFGLAAFSTEQRSKEVGIRKVLGASTASIFMLLSKTFFKWVLLSNLIAWPIGYLAMRAWLRNFAYRAPMSIWIFFLTAAAALAVALLTVMFQTMKASTTEPIESLRFE